MALRQMLGEASGQDEILDVMLACRHNEAALLSAALPGSGVAQRSWKGASPPCACG